MGNVLQMLTENDMAYKCGVLLCIIQHGRRRFKTSHDIDKPSATERAGCGFGARIKPRLTKIGKECGELRRRGQPQGALSQHPSIGPTPALPLHPAAPTQSSPSLTEQPP